MATVALIAGAWLDVGIAAVALLGGGLLAVVAVVQRARTRAIATTTPMAALNTWGGARSPRDDNQPVTTRDCALT